MKSIQFIALSVALLACTSAWAQQDQPVATPKSSTLRRLTLEPGIGIHTNFGIDVLLTNLVQWNPRKHLSIAAHSAFNINNVSQRNFNGIRTNYNFSLNQKVGVGTTRYTRKSAHTFLFMVGAKYTAYEETLDDENFDKVSVAISSLSPDYGLMYSLKRSGKHCFFTYRMYLPLYPWPAKGFDILYIDGNMNNIALEFGVGFQL